MVGPPPPPPPLLLFPLPLALLYSLSIRPLPQLSKSLSETLPGGTDAVGLTRRAARPPQNLADIRALLFELDGAGAAPRAWGRLVRDVVAALWGGAEWLQEPGGGARGDAGPGRTILWNCSCPGADAPAPGVS